MEDLTVLLIGGPPGAGTTTLGRTVAARLGFASLTVDDLAISARVVTTAESHPALHPMRPSGHTQYFTDGPPERLIADATALEETMWPVLERVIASHLATASPIVMDWWLLSPDRVDELEDDRIRSIWLHVDPNALEARERRNTQFFGDSPDPERMLANFMHRSLWRNDLVALHASTLNLPALHVSGDESVEELVTATLEAIVSRA